MFRRTPQNCSQKFMSQISHYRQRDLLAKRSHRYTTLLRFQISPWHGATWLGRGEADEIPVDGRMYGKVRSRTRNFSFFVNMIMVSPR